MPIWNSQIIQFIWFVQNAHEIDAEAVFEKLVGGHTDSVQKNRVPSPNVPFLSLVSKVQDGLSFKCQTQPGRFSFFVQHESAEGPPSSGVPCIETESNLALTLRKIQSLDGSEGLEANRISVVANTLKQHNTVADANSEFYHLTGLREILGEVTDLSFQVNKRRKIDDKLALNRVLQFQVQTVQMYDFFFDSNLGVPGGNQRIIDVGHYLGLNFDFNTVLTGSVFSLDEQKEAFHWIIEDMLRTAPRLIEEGINEESF